MKKKSTAAMLFVFSVTETARGGPSRGEWAFLMIMENPESILEELESECEDLSSAIRCRGAVWRPRGSGRVV